MPVNRSHELKTVNDKEIRMGHNLQDFASSILWEFAIYTETVVMFVKEMHCIHALKNSSLIYLYLLIGSRSMSKGTFVKEKGDGS